MSVSRREFLARGVRGGALLAGGLSAPGFLTRTGLAAAGQPGPGEPILVVVQLSGGNDGLNTVVPYSDEAYYRARPALAVGRGQVLPLSDELGLAPQLGGLAELFGEGKLAVIENVGYPSPNRSHFASMDIWHTCSDKPPSAKTTGWVGRVADLLAGSSTGPAAFHLDSQAAPLALSSSRASIPSVGDIRSFQLEAEGLGLLKDALSAERESARGDLQFVQRVALSSCINAEKLQAIFERSKAEAAYPGFGLADHLRQIAQLIASDFGPRVYYTSIGGFDTHARQKGAHQALLSALGQSVKAFFDDLKSRGLDEQVALMTFSEFGRRVKENASLGTDHGTAAPMFVAGAGVKGGLYGGRPDLDDLDGGDLKFSIDFRQVYAAALGDWLRIDPADILEKQYQPLPLFG